MNLSDINIQVALIALVSAFIGAIATAAANYLFQQRAESKKQIREKQKEVYYNYLVALQEFKNSSNNEQFYKFQNAVNAICLYGDDKTSSLVKEHFEKLVKAANRELILQQSDHTYYETKIINAMRDSLGLKKFDNFYMVKFGNYQ